MENLIKQARELEHEASLPIFDWVAKENSEYWELKREEMIEDEVNDIILERLEAEA